MTSPRPTVENAASPTPAQPRTKKLASLLLLCAAIFAVVFLLHLPVLSLPYYWDEAGYFIPAAHDILFTGDFIPHSTLSNAHPPLVMAYIALAWKLFGFHIAVARAAMLLVSSLTLLGVFRLSERVANRRVAWATLLCTALYPVFFAQSTLAHLDMGVAALTVWGLVFYLPTRDDTRRATSASLFDNENVRRGLYVFLFALAGITKETAVLTPLVLCGWELLCWLAGRKRVGATAFCLKGRRSVVRALGLLLALVPLALWFAYHHQRTGYTFGNPEYFRYNIESTVNLSRIFEALLGRLKHVTFHMNLYALTLAALVAMFFPARRDGDAERRRIDVPVQLIFALLILAHVVALSVVGGAVLARYMLPVYPLVILICVSTLWRRVRQWRLVVAAVCVAFAVGSVVNPPYSFPWEENLAYRDFVVLHRDAAHFISDKYPEARVLTTWPASDELKNPYFGYLDRPLKVFPVESFKREDVERAARSAASPQYDVALLFSTHGGLSAEEIAESLGGRIVYREDRKGQWVAVLER
ncbi:MAG: glycosyltransferase family 39 protein [Acidobacteria bacterium]|nr:glycosyltransferase family 39 protein [Acidobacteriota bacterium]